MSKKTSDVMVVGFALFAMFFGAGNLIFPPLLGFTTGSGWLEAFIGFAITGIGLPLLGVMAMSRNDGEYEKFAGKVGSGFSVVLGIIINLCIGPLFAIPRTGATTYELGFKPLFPGMSSLVATLIFFGITLFFVVKPSTVIDNIGKYLTPILLVTLFIIIIRGIIMPADSAMAIKDGIHFSNGFFEGYQTMDALAATLFSGIIISNIRDKGYTDDKEQMKMTIMAGMVSTTCLLLVYGGLTYLGAKYAYLFPEGISMTELLIGITSAVLGNWGKIVLGLAVAFACLTTAIGLTTSVSDYFAKSTNNKLSYNAIAIIITVVSLVISNSGVDRIVSLAVPILTAIYPVILMLIVLNVFSDFIKSRGAYVGSIIGALCISIFDGLSAAGVNLGGFKSILHSLPLGSSGFGWLLPAIIGLFLGGLLTHPTRSHNESL